MLAPSLNAQDSGASASPTPPQPPLLRRAPETAQWVITYKIEGESGKPEVAAKTGKSAKPTPAAKTKLVARNQDLIFERTVNENGVEIDWLRLQDGLAATTVNAKGWTVLPSPQPDFDAPDYSNQDFAGFDWISAQNFIGNKTVNGKKCLVFEDRVVTVNKAELDAIVSDIGRDFSWARTKDGKPRIFNRDDYKTSVTAYIDDETRLPVSLVYKTPAGETITRTYQFQPLSITLGVPPEVQAVFKATIHRTQQTTVGHAPI